VEILVACIMMNSGVVQQGNWLKMDLPLEAKVRGYRVNFRGVDVRLQVKVWTHSGRNNFPQKGVKKIVKSK
jgi:hypothetical protein